MRGGSLELTAYATIDKNYSPCRFRSFSLERVGGIAGSANSMQSIAVPQNHNSPSLASNHAEPETALREKIATDVRDAWAKSDFTKLDSDADRYLLTRARTFSGKWRLAIFAEALSAQMKIEWPEDWWLVELQPNCRCNIRTPVHCRSADLRWNLLQEKLDLWTKRFPGSPHAQIARAQFLVNRAWFYRGSGYSDSVPDVAWPMVSKYIELARDVLVDSKSTSIASPEWFNIMFFIASAQSSRTTASCRASA